MDAGVLAGLPACRAPSGLTVTLLLPLITTGDAGVVIVYTVGDAPIVTLVLANRLQTGHVTPLPGSPDGNVSVPSLMIA